MNQLELFIYRRVRRNPRLKRIIAGAYRTVFSLLPATSAESEYKVMSRAGYFFGFHDKCPWSADNRRLLAHRAAIDLRPPGPEDEATIGFFEGERFTPVATTTAWNFQQGSTLQWVGATGEIIFNQHRNGRIVAAIVDSNSGATRSLDIAVGAIDPSGEVVVGFDFPRLHRWVPGYGYAVGHDAEIDVARPRTHGISIARTSGGEPRLLFTVADIADIAPEPTMEDSVHCLSHTLFAPGGARFSFVHSWVKRDGRSFNRLMSSDLNGNVFLFPTYEMVSHVGWRDADHILAYARTKQWDDGYFLFGDGTNEITPVGRESFSSDGHPMCSPNGRYFVTDTYPDRRRFQSLIVYDTKLEVRHDLGRFRAPGEFNSRDHHDVWRCDLHPRWNRDGTAICFDSTYSGTRSLCTIDVGDRFSPA
jgi:hypothetical protein